MAGDHNHRQAAIDAFDLLQKLHPIHARHFDVCNYNPWIIGTKNFERIPSRRECLSLKPR